MQLFLKILSGMANGVDPDQTAPSGAVWSVSTLFAYAILSTTLVYEIFGHLPVFDIHWPSWVDVLLILNSSLIYSAVTSNCRNEQQRPWSDCTSAQSDQGFRCMPWRHIFTRPSSFVALLIMCIDLNPALMEEKTTLLHVVSSRVPDHIYQ